jgi:hypothetical protein
LLHNGVVRTAKRAVRQSVADVAAQVRRLAEARRLSANRILLELIENGIEADKRKQPEFFDLAERFRNATDPAEVERLGNQVGRIVLRQLMPRIQMWGICHPASASTWFDRLRD